MSVVDLNSNKVIGKPVKEWSVWPDKVSGGGDDGMLFEALKYNVSLDILTNMCS